VRYFNAFKVEENSTGEKRGGCEEEEYKGWSNLETRVMLQTHSGRREGVRRVMKAMRPDPPLH
jgi:hypothetical protein